MLEKRYSCVGGQFVPAHRAAVPVTDRGFRFGDGVFETIRLAHGVPYQWERHLARLTAGLAALRITPPEVDWPAHIRRLLHKNKEADGFLRIAVTRGTGSRGYLPSPPGMPTTWVIEQLPALPAPTAPCHLWLSTTARIPLQCLPMNHKLAHGVASTLALLEAHDNACDEALQLTTTGLLCEAASANLFWINGDTLFTPALETGCLNGTTRDAILRLAAIPTRLVQAGLADLQQADAVFLSNSRLGLWPVHTLHPMGWTFDTHHPMLKKLSQSLTRDRTEYTRTHRATWHTK